jgi:hypothetical protein
MATANLAQLRAPNSAGEAVFQELLGRSFDPDAWHVMQERDNALIRDEITHGVASKAFVYEFEIKGKKVTGVSVVGARELAAQYKGIKSRIVATIEKRGSLFIFRTFQPLSIETRHLPDLADEADYYECVMEVEDIKTGNSTQVRKKESKVESTRSGGTYERPHYDTIAESKARRNGILDVLPQAVIAEFKAKCLAAGNSSNEQTIDQRRAAAAAYAAKYAIAVDRQALAGLSFAELDGLGGAAAQGVEAFKRSAAALGLLGEVTGEVPPPAPLAPPPPAPAPVHAATPQAQQSKAAPATAPAADNWQPTPEQIAQIKAREAAEVAATSAAPAPAPAARRGRPVQGAIE